MLPIPTIAVLSSSPALTSVLAATLRRGHRWRVREFRESEALRGYMHVAPVALLVTDYDLADTNAPEIALAIRGDIELVTRRVQIIALSRTVDPQMRQRCVQAGIDEVIVKPMSPIYLEERIATRLKDGTSGYVSALPHYLGPERRDRISMSDTRDIPLERRGENVVSFLAHKAMREREIRPDA